MNCGCNKNIGCYKTGDIIDFGIIAPYNGTYTFEITTSAGFTTIELEIEAGEPIAIPFQFNENSTTIIKIKAPFNGFNPYLTSADGACCFEVSGIIPIC